MDYKERRPRQKKTKHKELNCSIKCLKENIDYLISAIDFVFHDYILNVRFEEIPNDKKNIMIHITFRFYSGKKLEKLGEIIKSNNAEILHW